MKDNSPIHNLDKKIQKTLKYMINNQNELSQLFGLAIWLFLMIYACIWIYNTLGFFQILVWFVIVWALMVVVSHKTQEEKKPKITQFFEKYIWDILYSSFIVFVGLSIYSFIVSGSSVLVFWFYSVVAIYIFSKLLGVRLMDSVVKTKGRNIDFMQIVIIFSSVVFVTLHYILAQFDIWDENYFITLWMTSIFIWMFVFLFSNLSDHSKKAVSREKIHSHMLGNTYRYLLWITIMLCIWIIGWQQFSSVEEGVLENESVFEQQFEEKPAEIIVEPIEEFIEEIPSVQTITVEARVEELYAFNNQLQVGDSWEDVVKLQEFMAQKEYYSWELDGIFDEETRLWLRDTLIGECSWPDSTRGIMWPQATVCINNIVVTYEQEIVPDSDDSEQFLDQNIFDDTIEDTEFNILEQDFE